MQEAAVLHQVRAGHLRVHQTRAGGHPLDIARVQAAVVAEGIAVLHLAVEKVGDGLKAAVRVVREAGRLAGLELERAHFVEQQEGIEVIEVARGEGSVDADSGALCSFDGGNHVEDPAGGVCGGHAGYLDVKVIDAGGFKKIQTGAGTIFA